jgi:hypothetical protein
MTVLENLNAIIVSLGLPIKTGVFSGVPPDEYVVLTPLADDFPLFGDNLPLVDIAEVRISLFSKHNYIKRKNAIVKALLAADFTITDRRYIGYENDTQYHHYVVDIAKQKEESEWQQ